MRSPLLILIAIALLSTSCQTWTMYQCIRPAGAVTGQAQSALSAVQASLWTQPKIPVCWLETAYKVNASGVDVFAPYREGVRQGIQDTWNQALAIPGPKAAELFEFVGWERCSESSVQGPMIHIEVADVRAHSAGLGVRTGASSKGIVLNFEYIAHQPICSESESRLHDCVFHTAVHEFGHALGFAHEQNRTDTPDSCEDQPQGTDPDTYLTPWDDESVMNYCTPLTGELSEGDVLGAQAAYYPAWVDADCAAQAMD